MGCWIEVGAEREVGATPPYQSQVNKRLAKPKEDNAKNVYQVTVNDEFNKSCNIKIESNLG